MFAADPIASAPIAASSDAAAVETAAYVRGMPPRERDLEIWRGDTFRADFRWEQEGWLSAPIQAITRGAFVRITLMEAAAIPDGWRVAVVDAQGLTELNAEVDPKTLEPRDRSMRFARAINASTVELNGISTALFRAHRPGTGYLVWRPPVPLAGYTARLAMRTRFGGDLLLPTLTTENGGLVIDLVAQTTTAHISDAATAALAREGIYDLEMVAPGGAVTKTFFGAVALRHEVTT